MLLWFGGMMASSAQRGLDDHKASRNKPSPWEYRGLGSCFDHACLPQVPFEGTMQVTRGWRDLESVMHFQA